MLKLTRFALLFFSFLIFSKSNKALNGLYFQQDVKYKINVTLDDRSHYLRGEEELYYKNNSPDTLRALYFHLWPNAYSNDQTVLAKTYYNDGDKRFINAIPNGLGFIDSLDFNVDGSSVRWELLTDTPDVARLTLHQPLLPGNSLQVRTPFRIKIPDASISRFGHTGQAYFVTQWYPKPAVYDDGGWKYFPSNREWKPNKKGKDEPSCVYPFPWAPAGDLMVERAFNEVKIKL